MNLLFVGDVVGKAGCDFLSDNIYSIKKNTILTLRLSTEKTRLRATELPLSHLKN